LESIDTKIKQGWASTQEKRDAVKGCDIWLEAWAEIKELFAEGFAGNIDDLDKKYKWSQWITNYVQFLEMELKNAGVSDPVYHTKRIEYCRELLQWCGDDDLLIANTRCAMAEAYFDSGDETGCDRLFEGWLQDDPDWGLGYRAWSECYLNKEGVTGYDKAEEILLVGYSRSGLLVEDKYEMTAHLMAIYDDTGRSEKFREFEKIFHELNSKMPGHDEADKELKKMFLDMQRAKPDNVVYNKPEPIRVVKIGRNEPCPCGSGKKYKKCCGA
jgi:hypothetical protein